MAEPPAIGKEHKPWQWALSIGGIMGTLLVYGVLQEKIMRIPYGEKKEFFRFFCAIQTGTFKYTCLFILLLFLMQALKYVSFPVQTLAKCAKMIPVMVWSSIIMQKIYNGQDYAVAVLVTLGGALFILYPAASDISPYNSGRENTVWGIFLMIGYLGFDGFTSTFQDKLFKGYDMEIHNQIFYTTLCSSLLSFSGLLLQGQLLVAIDFVVRHQDCLFDIMILSSVATASQFFISYTIRTFGALTFATIMTTRQLVSIMISCVWFGHPLTGEQWIGAVIVFGALYTRSFLKRKPHKLTTIPVHCGNLNQSNGNP